MPVHIPQMNEREYSGANLIYTNISHIFIYMYVYIIKITGRQKTQ